MLSHLHILIFSKSNLKLHVFWLFPCFVRTLIIKISSSGGPANTTSTHRVSSWYTWHFLSSLSKKYYKKVSITHLKTRRSALKVSQWRRTRRTKSTGACAAKYPSAPICYKSEPDLSRLLVGSLRPFCQRSHSFSWVNKRSCRSVDT